jgi:hypothetical protein
MSKIKSNIKRKLNKKNDEDLAIISISGEQVNQD